MRSQRRAARNVSVRQRPCGTLATSRWPRGARPWLRDMVVLAQVSSMKDQTRRIKPTLRKLPLRVPPGHVGAVLLAGVQAF